MSSTRSFLMGTMALVLLAVACSPATPPLTPTPTPTSTATGQMTSERMDESKRTDEFAPLVKGFYKGGEVQFIHTEASDPQVASMLTMMMGPQVVLVPDLAQIPEPLLADVYVFTNGVQGAGSFGFQPDVFDTVPGDQGYSPIRAIVLVTWIEGMTARELRSVDEVKEAESPGSQAISSAASTVSSRHSENSL